MSIAQHIVNAPDLLEGLKQLMRETDAAIMQVYNSDDFGTDIKGDASPVTQADLAAHHVIIDKLANLTPDIPVVSEEDADSLAIPKSHSTYWLIDPLDGTKEFIKRNGEFTCNVALIENNRPTLGFVTVPAVGELYVGGEGISSIRLNAKNESQTIKHSYKAGVTRIVASKSHLNKETEAFINAQEGEVELVQAGSSLKFLKIATGEADLYPRLAPTCEWDTAAAQAVLEGAGGQVTQHDGAPMIYGKEKILNPFFIATAKL